MPTYVSELAPVGLRGKYGTFIQFGVTSGKNHKMLLAIGIDESLGIISAYFIGYLIAISVPFETWRWMIAVGALFPLAPLVS